MEYSEEVLTAIIKAASDITVAKINAKGARFDNYTGSFNWFSQSIREVEKEVKKLRSGGS